MTDLQQLQSWLNAKESERLEFKEAKNNYDLDDLVKYATALANEGGGHMVLGVTARQPRQVVGSAAFRSLDKAKQILLDSLRLRVEAEELRHPDGRVVVFTIPSRPLGMPLHHKGAYWMRSGDQLVPMSTDQLRRILDESGPDFSAQICPGATLDDLDPAAIDSFRARWHRKSNNPTMKTLAASQLLHDAELLQDGQVTYAALILLGRARSLTRHLGQAEIVWEYRAHENYLEYQDRTDFRDAFFLMDDRLWEEISRRNELQHYQDGLYVLDLLTFNETVVREAILNAVSHRDYRMAGSVFVRQFPRKLEVESPGGLPAGINPENILWRQNPRNLRIAEVFRLCGLVERSGQGANRMFELSIKEGKAEPDFTGTDDYQVCVTLHGQIQDPRFIRFLEKIGRETTSQFNTLDFLILDRVYREKALPADWKAQARELVEQGILESVGRGRGARLILARKFYQFLGQKGDYTRRRGLDRETNKSLLLRHLRENQDQGSLLHEMIQVLPSLSRDQVQSLLRELQKEGRIQVEGRTKGARWRLVEPSLDGS